MLSIIRVTSKNIANQAVGLHKVTKAKNAFLPQAAFISHKEKRLHLPPRPAPFPYWKKQYRWYHEFIDWTLSRFDDNTKLIVVEGPIGVGKDKFCRDLANEFDWKYLPPLTVDDYFILQTSGIDIRDYDKQLPVNCQTHELKKYLKDPHHINTASYQVQNYKMKYDRYLDALLHLMSTGEGVVVQRCPWSDFVFLEAMYSAGYLTPNFRSYYYDMTIRTLHKIVKPHVVIYLDIDAKTSLERIKKRGNPDEVNSKVLTLKYLQNIEKNYKNKFFKTLEPYCHILSYDWSEDDSVDFVVEDLERLNFEYESKDSMMEEWNTEEETIWAYRRDAYSLYNREHFMDKLDIGRDDVDELMCTGEESEAEAMIMDDVPGLRYETGYDPIYGPTLFKMKRPPPEIYLRNKLYLTPPEDAAPWLVKQIQ